MGYNPKTQLLSGHNLQGIDYIPAAAVNAGDVIVIGGFLYFAAADIPANTLGTLYLTGGTWRGNKASGAWTNGADVYYDPSASPNVGTANSGAFTQTPSATTFYAGKAIITPDTQAAAASGDQYGCFAKILTPSLGTGHSVSIAAAGSTQANAAPLNYDFNFVTGANGTKGVSLPAGAAAGASVEVKNSDAANAVLNVYPATAGGTINALAAGTALAMGVKTACEFRCLGNDVWVTIPLLPS